MAGPKFIFGHSMLIFRFLSIPFNKRWTRMGLDMQVDVNKGRRCMRMYEELK